MFALARDLPEAFFADKIDRHVSRLRVRNHPAPTAPPKPGQLRAGAHCDYGSLTILRTEDKPGDRKRSSVRRNGSTFPSRPTVCTFSTSAN